MDKERKEKPILEEAADKVKKKKDLLVENIRSKSMIEDYLHGKLKKDELAYALAEDKQLRRTTEHVVEGIINPEPTKVLKAERDPVGIDFTHGFSTFWKEMSEPIDQKVSAAADVRDVLSQVNIGTDISEAPKIREEIYKDLGLDDDKIAELIPESEKVNYTRALEDHYKNEHMERLNLKDDGMLDIADEERINELVEDSMAMVHNGYEQIPPNFDYGQEPVNGYVEEYGMTAEELNRAFANAQGEDVYDYPPYDEIDDLSNYPTMNTAIQNVEAIYAGTLDDNKISLSHMESLEASMPEAGFSNDDLADLNHDYLEDTMPEGVFAEDDLQELNDEYLAHLANNAPPSLTDDDLMDLDIDEEDRQR